MLGTCRFALCIVGMVLVVGCGGGVKKPPALAGEQGAGANLAAKCTKNDCAPAKMNYEFSKGLIGKTIEFEKGVDNSITISGVDADGGVRRIYVLVGNFPKGATVSPSVDAGRIENSTTLSWAPTTIQRNKVESPFKVVLRDYDRCVVKNSERECQQYRELPEYDQSHEFSWEVVNGYPSSDDPFDTPGADVSGVSDVIDPECDEFVATSDGDAMNQGLSTGIGILSGLDGGAGFDPSILTSLFTGMAGGNQTPFNPDDC